MVCGHLPVEEAASAEQRRVWSGAAAWATRKNLQRGIHLNFRNLAPVPDARLWQSTPETPLRGVQSEPTRATLAFFNLHSSTAECQDELGSAAYA